MMDLSTRSALVEELDEQTTDLDTYQLVVTELALINRITLTHRPTLRWLAKATKGMTEFSVLDVGYGDGDLLRAIAQWASEHGRNAQLSGVDLNPRSADAARNATPEWMKIDFLTGDVFSYTPPEPVDFIVSSQVTHHFTDAQIVSFLGWVDVTARHGWHIVDLHRHMLPYRVFPALCRVMGWHRITRCDGVISIARGFRRDEWQSYLQRACVSAKVSWRLPFRYCLSRSDA